jgi:Thioredoxin domain
VSGSRLVVLVVLTAAAVGVAVVLQRRRPDPPSAPSYRAPAQLDRNDFTAGADRWLVALFGSVTCDTCPVAWATVEAVLATVPSGAIEAQRIDVQTNAELHRRYRIDGVPTTVVADVDGVVTQTFFGPMTSVQLRQALEPAVNREC